MADSPTAASTEALIDQRQLEIKALLDKELTELKDFTENWWDDQEWSDDIKWPTNIQTNGFSKPADQLDTVSLVQEIDDLEDGEKPEFKGDLSKLTTFNTRQLLDPQLDAIELLINQALANGGAAISQEYQDSIFTKDRERKLQALDDSLLKLNAGFGAKGFMNPSHLLTGARNEVIQKYQFDLENQSREIVKLMEDHYKSNWQFCVDKGLAVEAIHVDFISKYQKMFESNIELTVKVYQSDVDAYVALLGKDLDKIRAKQSLQNDEARLVDINNEKIKWDIVQEIDLATKRTAAVIADRANQAKVQLEGLQSLSEGYWNMYSTNAQSNINVKQTSTAGE